MRASIWAQADSTSIDTASWITLRWTRGTRYFRVHLGQDLWHQWLLTLVNRRSGSRLGRHRTTPAASIEDALLQLAAVAKRCRQRGYREGILRARYREGYGKKLWMERRKTYEPTVDMQATSNYFAERHRIRLGISSSNFPRFDRNLNTGGNNYDEINWKVAENKVWHTPQLPVVRAITYHSEAKVSTRRVAI